ncbi:SGNH/GDSL hydrolase family protein [Geodermatophilus maliterrae]|uniref:SGNH/GDSL hydrolase family protein n=1 Tax=Geodermatophilus maliterrae TaxID=3162531 RepID=A0ABV3XC86_9ACTN
MAAPVSHLAGLLVSCLLACPALAACGGTGSAEGPTTPSAAPTTTTAPTTPPTTTAGGVRAVFLGDSYTVGVGSDGPTYAAQVADRLGWTQVEAAQSGTGYVADGGGRGNAPFGDRVDDVAAADPDVVVVQGSTNDVGADPAAVAAAAAHLYGDLAAAVPDADVVVLGPLAPPEVPRPGVEAVRDALATAAGQAGLRFVDPVAGGWLEPPEGLYADGLHPDDEGYARLADELVEELRAAGW